MTLLVVSDGTEVPYRRATSPPALAPTKYWPPLSLAIRGHRKGRYALLSCRFAVLTMRFYRRAEFLDPVAGGIAAVPHFGAQPRMPPGW